jgi:hypothetical protein
MKPISRRLKAALFVLAACALSSSLIGCGSSQVVSTPPPPPSPPSPPPPVNSGFPGLTFGGKVLAGTQPIAGAAVQIYAAGTTGNGSASASLLTTAVTTDASGAFTIPASYYCPVAGSQLYVIARGGNVGTAAANSGIGLASVIGACNQLTASSQFVINEVTTVATVWALAQFIASDTSVGASATNAQGFANAIATVANLANITAGTSPGAAFPANGASPAAKINTVANLLNVCTAAPTSTPCDQLFTATTPSGGSAPDNTFDAALNLVKNPGNNVTSLYAQSTTSSVFKPALTSAPADWILFINYTGGGMDSPSALGVDATGNIWVASYFSSVAEFTSTGSPVFAKGITSGGLLQSYGLAIDGQSNVWVTNQGSPSSVNKSLGSVTVLNSAGQPVSGATGYSAGWVRLSSRCCDRSQHKCVGRGLWQRSCDSSFQFGRATLGCAGVYN